MTIDRGGPAFPTYVSREQYRHDGFETVLDRETGMSLRDYFAAAALAHMQVSQHADEEVKALAPFVARAAYVIADAMLAERSQS